MSQFMDILLLIKQGSYQDMNNVCPVHDKWGNCSQNSASQHRMLAEATGTILYSYLGPQFQTTYLGHKKCSTNDLFFFFFFYCTVWPKGSYFPNQGLNLCPLHWEQGVLTTGLPGKSQHEWSWRDHFSGYSRELSSMIPPWQWWFSY